MAKVSPAATAPGRHNTMHYHAVIFDLRGTLLEECPPRLSLNATMAQARSLRVDPIRFASCWFNHAHQTPKHIDLPWIESNLQAVCEDLGVGLDQMLRRRLAEQRERVIRRTLKPRRGAVRALTRLRAAGLRTAVVGDVPPDVRLMFGQTQLAKHIDHALLSTSGTCRHTDPRVLRHTLRGLGLPAKTCLYLTAGGLEELDHAERFGLQPVAFRPEQEGDEESVYEPAGPYPCVGTMIEVVWMAAQQAGATP